MWLLNLCCVVCSVEGVGFGLEGNIIKFKVVEYMIEGVVIVVVLWGFEIVLLDGFGRVIG